MNYRAIARAHLLLDEGFRLKPYHDSVGKLTIGVGRNLDDVGISASEADFLLVNDLDEAERSARRLLPNFDALSDVRRAVILNMAFNLGETRLAGFVNTLEAIREGRWDDAAAGMLASKWAKQVGARAVRLAASMQTNQEEP